MAASRNVNHFIETLNQAQQRANNTRPNSPSRVIRNDREYYLPGGDLFVLVESTLFRIHSYFFTRESRMWRHSLGNTTKGRESNNPLDLNTDVYPFSPIIPTDFASFLWVFYNPRHSLYETTEAHWLTIQRYAIIWDMQEVLNLAYRELAPYDTDRYLDQYIGRFHISSTPSLSLSADPAAIEAIRMHLEDDHGP